MNTIHTSEIVKLPAGAESKYRISKLLTDGFAVTGRDRPEVIVDLVPFFFAIRPDEGHYQYRSTHGLCEFGSLVNAIAERLMSKWQPPPGPKKPWFGIKEWATKQTVKCIAKRVHEQWRRLIETVDPLVLTAQKKCFAATRRCNEFLANPKTYENVYLVRDLCQYRAASIACDQFAKLSPEPDANELATMLPEYQAMIAAVGRIGLECRSMFSFMEQPKARTLEDKVGILSNWMALFSPTRETYGPLCKTLMNLPGGVSPKHLANLRYLELSRPLTKRLEVEIVTSCDARLWRCEGNLAVVMDAREDEIKTALRRLAEHLHQPLSARRTSHIRELTQFLADFPEAHHGRIAGLLDKSINWHRNCQQQEIEKTVERFGPDKATATPALPIPKLPGVRLLSTVADIIQEAGLIDHCVASYASAAVQGELHLLHVDYQGEMATVAVSSAGDILQAKGPRNQKNKAAAWGKRVLEPWGKQLGETAQTLPRQFAGEEMPF